MQTIYFWKISCISHDNTAVTISNEGLKTTLAVRFKTLFAKLQVTWKELKKKKKHNANLTSLHFQEGDRIEKKIYINLSVIKIT